jgi:hypothetical protein
MTTFYRTIFALSAFAPLWAIWAIRIVFEDELQIIPLTAVACGGAISLLASYLLFARLKRGSRAQVKISEVCYKDDDIIAYIITYIPVFVLNNFENAGLVAATIAIYVVIGILYIRLDIAYVNPMLALAGYRIASVTEAETGKSFIVLTKSDDLTSNERLDLRQISHGRLYYHE